MENNDNELLNTLKAVVSARDLGTFEDSYLKFEIEQAIGVINSCRRFTPTDSQKYDPKYEYLIIPMCVSALAKIGAEGQTSHTENGIQRLYGSAMDYPKELVQQIIPLIK